MHRPAEIAVLARLDVHCSVGPGWLASPAALLQCLFPPSCMMLCKHRRRRFSCGDLIGIRPLKICSQRCGSARVSIASSAKATKCIWRAARSNKIDTTRDTEMPTGPKCEAASAKLPLSLVSMAVACLTCAGASNCWLVVKLEVHSANLLASRSSFLAPVPLGFRN